MDNHQGRTKGVGWGPWLETFYLNWSFYAWVILQDEILVIVVEETAKSEVSESHFFILETRMRVSPIQSRWSRRDREFLTLTLRLRDETKKKFPPISGIETRSRFIMFTLRLRTENENSFDLISFFEMRPRILKIAIFPWNQAWTASLFCMQFLGG